MPFDDFALEDPDELDSEPESKERVIQNTLFAEDAAIWRELKHNLPDNFKDAVQCIIDRKGISQEKLAMRIGTTRSTLKGWFQSPSLRHAVAISIALNLRADIGEELVRLSGHTFQATLEHDILHGMLYETASLTVARANDIMRQYKLPLLCEGENVEYT